MVREAEIIELTNSGKEGTRYACSSSTTIPQGTILKLANPRTASASTGTGDIFIGIAAMEKTDADDSTSMTAYDDGIFEFAASGSITAGDQIITAAGGNYVMASNAITTNAYGKLVGFAVDTAASNKVRVKVKK